MDTSDLGAASALINEQNFEGSIATIGIFARSIFFQSMDIVEPYTGLENTVLLTMPERIL